MIFTEKRRANPPPLMILNFGLKLKLLFCQTITLYIIL